MGKFDDAFFREAKSQLQQLNDGLLAIENDDGDVAVDKLFRAAHSLKGSCHVQGLSAAGELAHALEDVLGAIRSGDVEPTTTLIDEALDAVDRLEALIRASANGDDLDCDVDASLSSLRAALEDHRTQPSPTGDTDDGHPPERTDDEGWDPADSELSDDVVAVLEETTEFDDVDALVDDVDDEASTEELDGWGLLDDDATPDSEVTDTTSDGAETPENPSAFFEQTKTDVEDADAIDSLQEDIDAVEFGEFDEDDNYTIDELLALDPDESPPGDDAASFDDRDAATEPGDDADGSSLLDGVDTERAELDAILEESPTDRTSTDSPVEPEAETEPEAVTTSAPVDGDADEDTANDFVFGGSPESESVSDGPPSDDQASGVDESGSEATPDGDPAGDGDDLNSDTPAISEAVPDPDSVPDTDLDVDLSGDLGVDADDAGMDVAVDEEMAAFESRFGNLLGDGSEDEAGREGPTFRAAVSTIEESRLDADDFPTAATTDTPEGPGEFDRLQEMTVDVDTADQLLNVAEELSLTHLRLDEAVGPETDDAISEEVANLRHVVTEYRRTVMDVRLMPLRTAVEGLPRTVRDIARSQNKEVELVVDDADVDLDRGIIDELRDPLVHVARNAVDHGIEDPDEREAAGKPPEGTIEISAERVDDRVIIEVSDDGRGIDPEAIRQRAMDKGICTQKEARRLDDDAVYDLLFEPGFTTREEVTDVSGRGVGMDVVSRTVADLNGTVTVDSEPGEGTTVRLTVPVSIVFTEVLFVEANEETFGIPMSVVEQITTMPSIRTEDGHEVIRQSDLETIGGFSDDAAADDSCPLIRLESALDLPSTGESGDDGQVIWVSTENERLAIRCDRVVTSREVVVRPYGDLLRDVPGVSGATTLGDGEAVNVLDVGSI